MTVEMKSKSDFHNTRIVKADGSHSVTIGDQFTTDWLHAKDLVANKLAEPVDPRALDKEPSDALKPHSSLSMPSLKAHNERRGVKAVEAENVRLRDEAGKLETLRGEHQTLRGEHETLKAEHEKLLTEGAEIAGERDRLKADHEKLLAHAAEVTAERDKLKNAG